MPMVRTGFICIVIFLMKTIFKSSAIMNYTYAFIFSSLGTVPHACGEDMYGGLVCSSQCRIQCKF